MAAVLFLDDEQALLVAVRRVLHGSPFESLVTSSETEAWKLFVEHHPEIVVCDFRMPSADAFRFLTRCHSVEPRSVLVLLTGLVELPRDAELQAQTLGIWRIAFKPQTPDELRALLDDALSEWKRREPLPEQDA